MRGYQRIQCSVALRVHAELEHCTMQITKRHLACVAVSLMLISAVYGRLLDMGDPRAQGHDHAPLKVDRYGCKRFVGQVALQTCEASLMHMLSDGEPMYMFLDPSCSSTDLAVVLP